MTIGTGRGIHLHLDHLLLVLGSSTTHGLHLTRRVPLRINIVHLKAVPDAL